MAERAKFLYVNDVMDALNVKRAKAYQIIRDLNEELKAEGYYIIAGRVSAKHFNERFYCVGEKQPSAPASTKAAAAATTQKRGRGRASIKYPHQAPAVRGAT